MSQKFQAIKKGTTVYWQIKLRQTELVTPSIANIEIVYEIDMQN